jgi:hypothetical protein
MNDGNSEYWQDAMKHWQRMFAQALSCLQEAMARGAKADNAEMLAKWDATQRKEIYTANTEAETSARSDASSPASCSQVCPTCRSTGFAASTRLPGRCQFCDGTVGGIGPGTPEFEKDYPANAHGDGSEASADTARRDVGTEG